MTRNTELRVFAIVIAALLLCELTLWKLEPALSGDVRHIRSMEEVSARLDEDDSPLRVLWLGNSITGDGVDLPLADSLFEQAFRHETTMYAVHPDGSAIAEWTHIANNQFFDRGAAPDVLVIPFAWNLLSDQSSVEAERIGRWYLHRSSDWVDFMRYEAQGFENGARAVLANLSAAFGNRERVRTRVLALLPGYQTLASHLSRGGTRSAPSTDQAPTETGSYTRLERLLKQADSFGTRVVLVAMPVRDPYAIDAGLLQRSSELGVAIIDARDVVGILPTSFRDEMHLLPAGARVVTERVVRELIAMEGYRPGDDDSYANRSTPER